MWLLGVRDVRGKGLECNSSTMRGLSGRVGYRTNKWQLYLASWLWSAGSIYKVWLLGKQWLVCGSKLYCLVISYIHAYLKRKCFLKIAVLWIEPRALHTLGKQSTTELSLIFYFVKSLTKLPPLALRSLLVQAALELGTFLSQPCNRPLLSHWVIPFFFTPENKRVSYPHSNWDFFFLLKHFALFSFLKSVRYTIVIYCRCYK